MKEMAVCIPTYNRAIIVEELLERILQQYTEFGWDIYIYDSSENDDTEIVVEKYSHFKNLFYNRIDSSVHSNLKVYQIFEEHGKTCAYKYVWVYADYLGWKSDILRMIQEALKKNYTFIVLNYSDIEKIGTTEYVDKAKLLRDCAWVMTLYGSTIVNTEVVLKDVDWKYMKKKYAVEDKINFSHVALYFERLSQLKSYTVKHISMDYSSLMVSPYKKESGWVKETFFVWGICWPSMVTALPECYNLYKSGAIRQVTKRRFTYANLVILRMKGILNYNVYKKYRSKWKELTEVSPLWIFLISIFPSKYACVFDFKSHYREKRIERNILKFCRKYNKVYVYGCGKKAVNINEYINKSGKEIEAYLVTDKSVEKSFFCEKPVISYDKKLLEKEDIGIILALSKKNTEEVIQMMGEAYKTKKCGVLLLP